VHQQDTSLPYGGRGGAEEEDGNISVTDCMPVSSVLNTIKINGDIVYDKIAITTAQWSRENDTDVYANHKFLPWGNQWV